MDLVSTYLGHIKFKGEDGTPIAKWMNRASRDSDEHRGHCLDFGADLVDLLNRLRARSWLQVLAKELDTGLRRSEEPSGEVLVRFDADAAARSNPLLREPGSVRLERAGPLILEVHKGGDQTQTNLLRSAVLGSFERTALAEAEGRNLAEVIKEKAFQAFQALNVNEIGAVLEKALGWADRPIEDASKAALIEILTPREACGVRGVFTREMKQRIFVHVYLLSRDRVNSLVFQQADDARKRLTRDLGTVQGPTPRKLCSDLLPIAALADALLPIVCANPLAVHRSSLRSLLENLWRSVLSRPAALRPPRCSRPSVRPSAMPVMPPRSRPRTSPLRGGARSLRDRLRPPCCNRSSTMPGRNSAEGWSRARRPTWRSSSSARPSRRSATRRLPNCSPRSLRGCSTSWTGSMTSSPTQPRSTPLPCGESAIGSSNS